jgi:prepilin-type N-terminal cleavage/methylation domain-containing protein
MRLLRSEKGFTLIEMLIVLGIMGAIGGAMTVTTATIAKITPQNNDQVVILRQVQNAGYWITRDVQMAQAVNSNPASGILELTTKEYIAGSYVDSIVTYHLEDMDGGLKKLMRTSEDSTILVAEDIYYNPDGDLENSTKILDYDSQTHALSFRISAKSGDVLMFKREYTAIQRVPVTQ